jgi:hypothetical protein
MLLIVVQRNATRQQTSSDFSRRVIDGMILSGNPP